METSSNNEEEDRISILPDTLIHHILSFLDMKDVIPTSILSRRWRYLWTSLPTLNFRNRSFSGNFNEFKDFVGGVFILRNNSDIQRFAISYDTNVDTTNYLNTWILAALRHNVQQISIDIHFRQINWLSESLFYCSSLTNLELIMRRMSSSKIVLPDSMCLPSLKSLNLESSSFDDEIFITKLFSSCPVLESFSINGHIGCMSLGFSSLTLKHFRFIDSAHGFCEDDGQIKLYAPNLTSFSCEDYSLKDYCLENLSSLVTADMSMGIKVKDELQLYSELPSDVKEVYALRLMKCLRALHNVKVLTLSTSFLEVILGAPVLLESQPLQFCKLQCLKLETRLSRDCMDAITFLLKISPNIESLFLETFKRKSSLANIGDNLIEKAIIGDDCKEGFSLPCMLYHLKIVEVRGFVGSVNELKLLELLVKNGITLEKVIFSSCKHSHGIQQLMKLSEKILSLPRPSSNLATFFF